MTIQDMDGFYSQIQKKKFSIYSSNGTRKLIIYSTKTLSTSERTMGQNSKIYISKNSV
jgi:hypothetical protein